jgi:hypothetical protein
MADNRTRENATATGQIPAPAAEPLVSPEPGLPNPVLGGLPVDPPISTTSEPSDTSDLSEG